MRRGAYAVEFALLLPMLMILGSGVIDLGQYLVTADALVAAVSDGARAGALADPDEGEDPIVMAQFVADRNFVAADLPTSATFVASYDASAPPDQALILVGTADVVPYFGFVNLPASLSYQIIVRVAHQ